MQTIKNIIPIPAFIILIILGCEYKNVETSYSKTSCDTVNVKYSTTISQIINTNCINCHSGSMANGNPQVRLDSYDGVKTVVDNGRLYNALTGATKQMPPGGRLNNCIISQVKAWINNGSPDN